MADISKINAVLIANIAEIDDVLAANIAKVNGLVFSTAPAVGTPVAAYSVRLLGSAVGISSYTGDCIRIREDSGDTETDIGFDGNGDLDTAAIASHCGSANGYVVTWYNQVGSNNATQGTSGSQPQIYNGTAVITENGKPAIQTDGTNDHFDLTLSQSASNYAFVYVTKRTQASGWLYDTQTGRMVIDSATEGLYYDSNFRGNDNPTTSAAALYFLSLVSSSSAAQYINGTLDQSSLSYAQKALGGSQRLFGAYDALIRCFGGLTQEFIVWASSDGQSSNRTGIEVNINDHYLIGNFPNPTSGLLATYTGAAAAYSVRQLANTAALAMRIREDGTDTETDIGFDANGDLDTAAIASHCSTNNGYVVTWYDQAGSQKDATQSTTTAQPQIYNGTAVITDNGKPAVSFAKDFLDTSNWLDPTTNSTYSAAGVARPQSQEDTMFNFSDGTELMSWHYGRTSGVLSARTYNGSTVADKSGASTNNTQFLGFTVHDFSAPSTTLHLDGVAQTGTAAGRGLFTSHIGSDWGGSQAYNFDGYWQELVFWHSDQSSNRSGIETDINGYFSIYT